MAFNYAPSSGQKAPQLQYGDRINFGSGLKYQTSSPNQQQVDYSNQFPVQGQQGGQSIDPGTALNIYKQFAGSGSASGGGLSGLQGLGATSGGLGGSGLIGSASGATSAAANGGASFGLGGSLVGGTGTVGGSTFAAGAGTGAASGSAAGAGAGASGAGGAAAAAGPWAALAAIIMLNEEDSRKKGLRSENRGERTRDQLTGKVLTQDIEGKWGPMEDKWTGGKASSWGLVGDQKGASQIMSGRIAPGLKSIWNDGSLSKIRKLF